MESRESAAFGGTLVVEQATSETRQRRVWDMTSRIEEFEANIEALREEQQKLETGSSVKEQMIRMRIRQDALGERPYGDEEKRIDSEQLSPPLQRLKALQMEITELESVMPELQIKFSQEQQGEKARELAEFNEALLQAHEDTRLKMAELVDTIQNLEEVVARRAELEGSFLDLVRSVSDEVEARRALAKLPAESRMAIERQLPGRLHVLRVALEQCQFGPDDFLDRAYMANRDGAQGKQPEEAEADVERIRVS